MVGTRMKSKETALYLVLSNFMIEEILTEEKLAKHCNCEHICSLEILLLSLCPAVDVQYPSPGTTTSLNLATESLATVDSFAKKIVITMQ